ncbi:MAG: gamma-glutamyl-gamma-aminobutyrate hydrolase family protein [Candidatus Dojkabacteria bacterium]
MTVLIIDNHTDYIEALKSLLKDFDVSVKYFQDLVLEDKDNYDLIILSGGYHHASVSQDPIENKLETEIITSTSKPIIGICYGSQLIAEAFGSKIEKLDSKVAEINEIKFSEDFLDYKKDDIIKVHESHRYAITTLGSELTKLAESVDGVEVFEHKTKPIFGIQFHPELEQEETNGDELFKKLLQKI